MRTSDLAASKEEADFKSPEASADGLHTQFLDRYKIPRHTWVLSDMSDILHNAVYSYIYRRGGETRKQAFYTKYWPQKIKPLHVIIVAATTAAVDVDVRNVGCTHTRSNRTILAPPSRVVLSKYKKKTAEHKNMHYTSHTAVLLMKVRTYRCTQELIYPANPVCTELPNEIRSTLTRRSTRRANNIGEKSIHTTAALRSLLPMVAM